MQPIERYGVVALLFVVIAVVTVVAWGGEDPVAAKPVEGFLAQGAQSSGGPGGPPAGQRQRSAKRNALPLEADSLASAGGGLRAVEPLRAAPRAAGAVSEANFQRSRAEPQHPTQSPSQRGTTNAPAARTESNPTRQPDAARTAQRTAPPQARERAPKNDATAGGEAHYEVRAGDTLSQIAQRELGKSSRWKEIVALNPGLDPLKLSAGKRLRMPDGAGNVTPPSSEAQPAKSVARNTPAPSSGGAGVEYKVQNGDSLWRIAQRTLGNGERWREIPPLNPGLNADKLKVDMRIVLPAGANVNGTATAKVRSQGPTETVARAERPRGKVR